MPFIATTTVSILRGTQLDQWGYEQDTDAVYKTGIPMGITARNKTVIEPVSSTPKTVRWYTGRCITNLDITEDDRIVDERTGDIYTISSVTSTTSFAQTKQTVLDLVRV